MRGRFSLRQTLPFAVRSGFFRGMRKPLLAILLALGLVSCYTVPESGRTAFNFVPHQQVVALGVSEFENLKAQIPQSRNRAYQERLERVGRAIAAQSSSGIPPDQWEFVVFASDQVNAFALPGGKIGVYEGMMELADNDDLLAIIVGHEVFHVDARHSGERLSQQLGIAALTAAGSVALDQYLKDDPQTRALAMAAIGVGAQYGILLPYSRQHEREADVQGLMYAARAGYDPRVAIDIWQRMENLGGPRPPEFLSTHPDHGNRIENLRAVMPQAIREYQIATGRTLNWPDR